MTSHDLMVGADAFQESGAQVVPGVEFTSEVPAEGDYVPLGRVVWSLYRQEYREHLIRTNTSLTTKGRDVASSLYADALLDMYRLAYSGEFARSLAEIEVEIESEKLFYD